MRYYLLALGTMVVVCVGCVSGVPQALEKAPVAEHVAPPASMLSRPGPMVDGPGPGVIPMLAGPPAPPAELPTTQIRFVGQTGMQIGWQVADTFAENQLVSPGRYDFVQGATYRLKLTNLPNRPNVALYPSLQVYPGHPTTDAYLSHNTVPVELTDEDLDQVEANNLVTKVIYLPDPKFQELAIAGVETLVSTRLEPGVDPVAEAARRGTVMVVLSVGNLNLETAAAEKAAARGIQQVAFQLPEGERVPPMPISFMGAGMQGVPNGMVVANSGRPGLPSVNPISGGNMPQWGMPMTSTPIGLPGPPHLPYGGPAGLKSHTVRNLSPNRLPGPVDHMLIDVKHNPGYSLPKPVKHVQYTETHPVFRPGEVSYPAWSQGGGPMPPGTYGPPAGAPHGMMPAPHGHHGHSH